MNKTRSAGIVTGVLLISLFGASTASAAECVAAPPVFQTVTTPFIPATEAETHEEYKFERTTVTPGTPATPAIAEVSHQEYRFERVIETEPAVPGKDAVYETKVKWSKSTSIQGWTKTDETRTVVTKPGVEEVSHQEYRFQRTVIDQPYVPGTPAVPAEIGTRVKTPEIPYAAAEYTTVVVTPAVPAQDAVYATAYQYQKQVRGVVQTRKGNGAWKDAGTFDWKWYPATSTQWSERNVEVLETGGHNSVLNETQSRREVTTNYRYVKNGVTKQGSLIKAAVPAKPAETKQVLVKAEQPFVPATYENYEITPAIPAVAEIPEVSHVETTDWVRETPAGEGWTQIDERKVVDTEAVEEVSHTEYKHTKEVLTEEAVAPVPAKTERQETDWVLTSPEGEGWETFDERKVVDAEAVEEIPAVPESSVTEKTDWVLFIPETRPGLGEWVLVDTRVVTDKEATEAVPATTDKVLVTPAVVCPVEEAPKPAQEPSESPTALPVTVTGPKASQAPVKAPAASVKAAPVEDRETLAHTGADPAVAALLGSLLVAGGAGAVALKRRRTN